ncbi:hypothetical protein QBC43DRAFT_326463 [Cladorrhinum sp. PSN259]|nr:hypothetical protein QBC43DRAFT_326463 [Cladorrhinum sp. PSN259]
MSYAEVAAKGPKQTPEEAAAPPQPEIISTEFTETSSLVDVDGPSVRTVPADFESQSIKTETQAARIEREEAARRDRERKMAEEQAASTDELKHKARAEADLAKKKAKKADRWVTGKFEEVEGTPAGGAIALANLLAVVGISGWLGFKAWGLYDKGRLGWKEATIGLGILAGVGAFEGVLGRYFAKAKKEKKGQ